MDRVKNPWKDTQIRLEGACTSILNTYFLKDWLCSIKRCDWEDTIRYLKEMKQESYEMTTSYCRFIAGGVDTDKEAVKMCYLL